ncbi:hypothetical protein [Peristeroidobacter agariperforans]|uniref:hypothetical protein n=1 Tax=Peristeroidobacter agariperforans TaxID=268404 RepID=UPI00101B8E9C|nr:hypothetical protein [Peristeroidobacter agariperforans]
MFARFSRSRQLLKASGTVLRQDKELLPDIAENTQKQLILGGSHKLNAGLATGGQRVLSRHR